MINLTPTHMVPSVSTCCLIENNGLLIWRSLFNDNLYALVWIFWPWQQWKDFTLWREILSLFYIYVYRQHGLLLQYLIQSTEQGALLLIWRDNVDAHTLLILSPDQHSHRLLDLVSVRASYKAAAEKIIIIKRRWKKENRKID